MNRTEGNTVNVSTTSTQSTTSGNDQAIAGLHPGYTTLISLGIAIFVIIIYLYYKDVLELGKRVSTGRRSSSQSHTTKSGFEDNCGNDVVSATTLNMTEIQTKTLLKEPAIRCECGQVHILKECLNDAELGRYKALFSHFQSEDEAKRASAQEEIPKASQDLGSTTNKPKETSDLRVDEGFASNTELPHVVECELPADNSANTFNTRTGSRAPLKRNYSNNSHTFHSSKREVCSIHNPIIHDGLSASNCNEDTCSEYSVTLHETQDLKSNKGASTIFTS